MLDLWTNKALTVYRVSVVFQIKFLYKILDFRLRIFICGLEKELHKFCANKNLGWQLRITEIVKNLLPPNGNFLIGL